MMKWFIRYALLLALISLAYALGKALDGKTLATAITVFIAFIGSDLYFQNRETRIERQREADIKLFSILREQLPFDPVIRFFREHDFSNHFPHSKVENIEDFISFCDSPSTHFLSPELKAANRELIRFLSEFIEHSINLVYSADSGELLSVPKEWNSHSASAEDKQRFQESVDTLNRLASYIDSAYEEFIKLGKSTLHIN
jgi:hypothetical protein